MDVYHRRAGFKPAVFFAREGRVAVRDNGGGWRYATASDLLHAPARLYAPGGFRGD